MGEKEETLYIRNNIKFELQKLQFDFSKYDIDMILNNGDMKEEEKNLIKKFVISELNFPNKFNNRKIMENLIKVKTLFMLYFKEDRKTITFFKNNNFNEQLEKIVNSKMKHLIEKENNMITSHVTDFSQMEHLKLRNISKTS
jgi:hypothetical protein